MDLLPTTNPAYHEFWLSTAFLVCDSLQPVFVTSAKTHVMLAIGVCRRHVDKDLFNWMQLQFAACCDITRWLEADTLLFILHRL